MACTPPHEPRAYAVGPVLYLPSQTRKRYSSPEPNGEKTESSAISATSAVNDYSFFLAASGLYFVTTKFVLSVTGSTVMKEQDNTYKWIGLGDINGFFGLMFDNMAVLSFLAGTLIVGFNFPAEIVYTRMFPGTTLGVLFGDLLYTWMAFRLAKKTGSREVTAMPLGLDTPSTIGLALAVLGPAFVALKQDGETVENAALMTWYIGMATMVMIGVLKVIMSFCGNWIQKVVPRAGLLGSLAGVGLMLIGFIPLVDVFGLARRRNDFARPYSLHIGSEDSTAEKHSRNLCSCHPGNRPLPPVPRPGLRRTAG